MKPSNKAKHKTLVLVGSRGDAIAIRRFLGLTILTTCVSIVTVVAIIYLFFASNALRKENVELKEALSEYQQKTKRLKNENDILMARLVSESERKIGGAESTELPVETSPSAQPSHELSSSLNIEEEIRIASQTSGKSRTFEKIIEVENLVVTHESNTKTLRVRFDLRNVDPNLNPISGRTVVVLKTDDQIFNNWLTLPFVPLVSGKPASTSTGRTFLISRFKTVKFSIAGQTNPNRFKAATVFVFSKTGEQLLEKDFKIRVKEVLASSATPEDS